MAAAVAVLWVINAAPATEGIGAAAVKVRLGREGTLPMIIRIYFLAILFAASVLGQTGESLPAFETASVKLNSGAAGYFDLGPGRIEMHNVTLKVLIFMAYHV